MKKSQSIVWTQRVMRTTPRLTPGTSYRQPGSRFEIMMRLTQMGASDWVFYKHVPGIDSMTIRALRNMVNKNEENDGNESQREAG